MNNQDLPQQMVYGLDIGTRSIVGTVGYKTSLRDFTVVAQYTKLHETRAMKDGQIHDIQSVSETIAKVTKELSKQTGRPLSEVCIAAAGRVLKTATAKAEIELDEETVITEEMIHSLEMLGVEQAHKEMQHKNDDKHKFFCVAYTVVHYYLNDFVISSLLSHKAVKIGAEVLATFLPDEVIDGLYSAVQKADLSVANLTLEPIAAMEVAIPENYRLLNIALVDVGAGTSDICITKDGSVIAYGMIPKAGDLLTEEIARKRLVEFKTAEEMKIASSSKRKTITYKDIMGIKTKLTREEVLSDVQDALKEITGDIADEITKLNGGKPVSAVFVVGGGGKITGFTELLSKKLSLPKERVALRGEEVMNGIIFLQEEIKKDPLLVTPIGICLNYYEQRNNFIFVRVNEERIKLYDNGKLSIVDAALSIGYPNEQLFPKRGKELTFTLNGEKRMVRGEVGEPAVITLNGKPAGINAPIAQNDEIVIEASTTGKAASLTVGRLPEYKQTMNFLVNNNLVVCPKYLLANGKMVSEYYEIQEGDAITSSEYYTLSQVLAFLDIIPEGRVYVNHLPAGPEEKVYENFSVNLEIFEDTAITAAEEEPPEVQEEDQTEQEKPEELPEQKPAEDTVHDLMIYVNERPVTLKGKKSYLLADVLEVVPFDLSEANGREAIVRVNDIATTFMQGLAQGDRVLLYWKG